MKAMRSIPLVLLAVMAGCEPARLYVQSDGAWSGEITEPHGVAYSIEGEGSRAMIVADGACWTVTTDGAGWLEAFVESRTIFQVHVIGFARTTTAGGTVTGCYR